MTRTTITRAARGFGAVVTSSVKKLFWFVVIVALIVAVLATSLTIALVNNV